MDSTRRTSRSTLRRVAMMAALAALLAPATAAEAAKKKVVKKPVVTKVAPMNASIGQTMTIYGRNFRRGKGRNTVVFQRSGARAVFVVADVATTKQIRVVLPAKLNEFLLVTNGVPTATRFRIRVLSQRFGKSFTTAARSPRIGPVKPPAPPAPPAAAAEGDCDGDGVRNGLDADDDNDLLGDDVEISLKTDPCNRDSDGDSVEDGFEHRSAQDLNDDDYQGGSTYLPYPAKRPYPNALFNDSAVDYDGDGLTLSDESRLWVKYGERNLGNLNYSDGEQYTRQIATVGYDKQQQFLAAAAAQGYSETTLLNMNGATVPGDSSDPVWAGDLITTDVERYYYDYDQDGRLSDDERDEDADGLPNWAEAHGYMTPDWWKAIYEKETSFVVPYAGTEIDDPDSDGDGVPDGADDQDHDDVPNVRELSRRLAAGEAHAEDVPAWTIDPNDAGPAKPVWMRGLDASDEEVPASQPRRAWLNPFNPCLPNHDSRTCPRYVPAANPYPPFDPEDPIFLVFN